MERNRLSALACCLDLSGSFHVLIEKKLYEGDTKYLLASDPVSRCDHVCSVRRFGLSRCFPDVVFDRRRFRLFDRYIDDDPVAVIAILEGSTDPLVYYDGSNMGDLVLGCIAYCGFILSSIDAISNCSISDSTIILGGCICIGVSVGLLECGDSPRNFWRAKAFGCVWGDLVILDFYFSFTIFFIQSDR